MAMSWAGEGQQQFTRPTSPFRTFTTVLDFSSLPLILSFMSTCLHVRRILAKALWIFPECDRSWLLFILILLIKEADFFVLAPKCIRNLSHVPDASYPAEALDGKIVPVGSGYRRRRNACEGHISRPYCAVYCRTAYHSSLFRLK
jgi:hypothetical protein